jgi:type IV pilus assembly protein PilA
LYKYIYRQNFRNNKGFTLIELLVVVIILGILAAMALPAFFSQVGRAREAEAKQILSSIGFAQQGYFFENSTFADSYEKLEITFQSNNYVLSPPTLVSPVIAKSQANAIDAVEKNARSYGMAVYYENSAYRLILCQSESPASLTVAPDNPDDNCSDDGKKIK